MDRNVIRARKCCFCATLQTGCITLAIFQLFCSGMNIDYIFYLLNNTVSRETSYTFPAQKVLTSLQLVPDLITIIASFILVGAVITQYLPLFWVTICLAIIQALYLVVFSVASSVMCKNLIVNQSLGHNVTYWIYVVIWLGMTVYFVYITYSYYRELKDESIPNGGGVVNSLQTVSGACLRGATHNHYVNIGIEMCQAEKYFPARHFCRCLPLRTGCIIIALASNLLGILSLAGFFRSMADKPNEYAINEILGVIWGVLHFVAANCLSVSLIMKSPTPILVYIVIEAAFLAFSIIYVPLSTLLSFHVYNDVCLGFCIPYWVYVGVMCVFIPYFLYITISVYVARRQFASASLAAQMV